MAPGGAVAMALVSLMRLVFAIAGGLDPGTWVVVVVIGALVSGCIALMVSERA